MATKTGGSIRWLLPRPTSTSAIQKVRSCNICREKPCDELRNENNEETQGAQRAETKGAARWAAWANCPTELWTDSEQVIEGLNEIRTNVHHKRKNAETCGIKYKGIWMSKA